MIICTLRFSKFMPCNTLSSVRDTRNGRLWMIGSSAGTTPSARDTRNGRLWMVGSSAGMYVGYRANIGAPWIQAYHIPHANAREIVSWCHPCPMLSHLGVSICQSVPRFSNCQIQLKVESWLMVVSIDFVDIYTRNIALDSNFDEDSLYFLIFYLCSRRSVQKNF